MFYTNFLQLVLLDPAWRGTAFFTDAGVSEKGLALWIENVFRRAWRDGMKRVVVLLSGVTR
jgi:hypothetical protein